METNDKSINEDSLVLGQKYFLDNKKDVSGTFVGFDKKNIPMFSCGKQNVYLESPDGNIRVNGPYFIDLTPATSDNN